MLELAQEDAVRKARAALTASPVTALHGLDVQVDGDRLIIVGRTNCFYHKQLAQEVVRSVVEGIRVRNGVFVDSTPNRPHLVDDPSPVG
jgi:hypothetical protein